VAGRGRSGQEDRDGDGGDQGEGGLLTYSAAAGSGAETALRLLATTLASGRQ
jgi:hypothetical protein